MEEWVKAMDLSSLLEVERAGGKFSNNGKEEDVMDILKSYGMNMVRLRLWNDPYTEDGISYGGGGCDLETVLTLARRAKDKGIGWLLDFHYSDCWADPGKQIIPKAWKGMDVAGLEQAVYDYTLQTLAKCESAGIWEYCEICQRWNPCSALYRAIASGHAAFGQRRKPGIVPDMV